MMRLLLLITFMFGVQFPESAQAEECVILIHGLGRTKNSLSKIKKTIKKKNYRVISQSYPSRHETIEQLAGEYIPKWVKECEGADKVNFITHSMGGIMVRYYLGKIQKPKNLGRVVMLAPPNHGSELVDNFGKFSRLVLGPANKQLGTEPDSLPNQLGPADYSLGIVAGSKTANPLTLLIFDEPNDGKVTTESSKLEGMKEHVILPYTHTFMMERAEVIEKVISFLEKGSFK